MREEIAALTSALSSSLLILPSPLRSTCDST
jgi:hypothetical protein